MSDILAATRDDVPRLYALYAKMGHKEAGYFERCFDEGYDIFMIRQEGADAGFCVLNFAPLYSLYRKMGFPELQDLNVLPEFRRRGLAGALIDYCEDVARRRGAGGVGISVGLTRDYGAAQRLYVKKGYIPDGFGVTYEREPVSAHAMHRVDDHLCLMLYKEW